MDTDHFDRLTKTLSTTGTRRGALALLSGSLSLLGLPQTAQGRKRRGGRDVTIQGPCGDGSGPANTCDRPGDCCTGICERSQPDKPKRCRCRRQGQPCTKTRNCCQGAGQEQVCVGGTCQPGRCTAGSCPTGQVCQSDGTCACDATSCAECQTCGNTGACVADAAKLGQDCGQAGQVCQQDGTCACGANSCGACQSCDSGSGACMANASQNGQACGAGGDDSFCCANGVCPQPSGCLSGGSPCGPTDQDCFDQCCTHGFSSSQGSRTCLKELFGSCESDQDCRTDRGSVCHCGGCCQTAGSAGDCANGHSEICCSGACNGAVCA
jgi:hypothetical protein